MVQTLNQLSHFGGDIIKYVKPLSNRTNWSWKDKLHMTNYISPPATSTPGYRRTSYISPPATTSTWLWKDMLHFNFCCHFLPLKTPWDRIWLWSSSYLFSSSWIWSVSEALSKNIFNWIINQNTNHHKHFYGLIRFCRGEMIFLFNIQWIVSSGFSAGIIILSSFDTLYWQ